MTFGTFDGARSKVNFRIYLSNSKIIEFKFKIDNNKNFIKKEIEWVSWFDNSSIWK